MAPQDGLSSSRQFNVYAVVRDVVGQRGNAWMRLKHRAHVRPLQGLAP